LFCGLGPGVYRYEIVRVVVLDEPKQKDDNNQEQKPQESKQPKPVKWWLPFRCGQKTTIHTKNGSFGGACNSRGCLTCHQKKIRKSISAIEEVKKYPGSSLYAIVLSPKMGRVKTAEDVNSFLKSFRKLLRRWQRSNGLHFGYWVAETVIKDNESPTKIHCPIGQYLDDDYSPGEKKLHDNCKNGNCPICKGLGYLPSVHLHIHLVVCCDSFWFGRGEVPKDLEHRFKDFGGLGWWNFCESENLGVSKCQLMRTRKGMVNYVSKACINYLAKVDKTTEEPGQVDWMESQRGAMVASYIYGTKRHRGSCGSIYGITKRTRDVTNYITVQYDPPKHLEKNITSVFQGEYKPTKKTETPGGVYLETLKIGIKAQEKLNPRITNSNVLIETELDIELGKIYTTTKEGYIQAPTIQTKTLNNKWKKCQVIGEKSLWFKIDQGLLIIGKGQTVLSFPSRNFYQGGFEYIQWLFDGLLILEYRNWWQLFHYPFEEVA